MNKERELLGRAKNNLAKLCSVNSMSSSGEMLRLIDEAIKGIDEFLASEPEEKPVAWTNPDELNALGTDITCYIVYSEPMIGENSIPLYTRPAQERKPMTVEDLETLARRCDYENDKMAHWHKTNFEDGFIAGWKQAEKHHGIGEEE